MINDRIAFLISVLNLNPNSFADKIGVSTTVIYNIVKGRRTKPSFDLLLKILNVFNQVNTDWLLTGEGANWFNQSSQERPTHRLKEKVEILVDRISENADASLEAQELAELSSLLLSELKEKQKSNDLLIEQNEQIMSILRARLGLNI
jgi:transcriptional regulator with XRE-family HTH domain